MERAHSPAAGSRGNEDKPGTAAEAATRARKDRPGALEEALPHLRGRFPCLPCRPCLPFLPGPAGRVPFIRL